MRRSSAAAKCADPAPRWRLSVSLIALLLFGSGADFAPALAAGMGDSNLAVATSSSSLAGGTAKLIVGTLHREGDKFVGDYRLKVFPYFFKSEKGGLFIRVSEPALRRVRGGRADLVQWIVRRIQPVVDRPQPGSGFFVGNCLDPTHLPSDVQRCARAVYSRIIGVVCFRRSQGMSGGRGLYSGGGCSPGSFIC